MGTILNRMFTREDTPVAIKHIKRCSASFVIREIKIKTTVNDHYTAVRMGEVLKA